MKKSWARDLYDDKTYNQNKELQNNKEALKKAETK
jgi:hypothetical protein